MPPSSTELSQNQLFIGMTFKELVWMIVQVKRLLRHGPLQDAEVSWVLRSGCSAVISLEIGNIFRSRSTGFKPLPFVFMTMIYVYSI